MSPLRKSGIVLRAAVVVASVLACLHALPNAPVSTANAQGATGEQGAFGASPEITDAGVAAIDVGPDTGLPRSDSSILAFAPTRR